MNADDFSIVITFPLCAIAKPVIDELKPLLGPPFDLCPPLSFAINSFTSILNTQGTVFSEIQDNNFSLSSERRLGGALAAIPEKKVRGEEVREEGTLNVKLYLVRIRVNVNLRNEKHSCTNLRYRHTGTYI